MRLTPRQRVMRALRGEKTDQVPFSVYECFVPPSTAERILRSRGMCVVWRTRSYRIAYKGVNVREIRYEEGGRNLVRTEYTTPLGTLSRLEVLAENTAWTLEYPFQSPKDYPALHHLFSAMQAEPAWQEARQLQERLGEDYLVRDNLPLEPLQWLISGNWMDPQTFALEWMDNRDELLRLYEQAVRVNRQCYAIVAQGPLQTVNYGGNVVAQIIGPQVYRDYYMPHYQQAADVLHRADKLIGCHYDADNTLIMADIAATPLDYIEAYDPVISPGVPQALACFASKALWINWPSAWHLQVDLAARRTRSLVEQAKGNPRFLIGITEDTPPDTRPALLKAIQQGIRQAGK